MVQLLTKLKPLLLVVLFFIPLQEVQAQDELDDLLGELADEVATNNYVLGTFKSPRVVNGHSVEMVAPGAMEFRIAHRFGRINSGGYNLWGLDQATIRLGLDFGLTNWLMTGIGRSSYEKTYDGFVKIRLLRQTDGAGNAKAKPVTLNFASGMIIRGQDWNDPRFDEEFSHRLSYYHMLLIARKFSNKLSGQFTTALTHQNFVETNLDQNLRVALGTAARYKITNRMALTGEYFYRVPFKNADFAPTFTKFENNLTIGFDIETGGHIFQLHLTNSLPMMERGFINETTGRWLDGDIHFGFNITREFTLKSNQN